MSSDYQYLFGPVPSRRFGLSLGVDLVPFKTCSFDCVFCQLGRTTDKTVTRAEYVPIAAVIDEVAQWLKEGCRADYITLSGSGEPTLHARFGEVIRYVRSATDIPVVVLTNGSLLWDPQVRTAAAGADVVKISLSAWDDASCTQINRPHSDLTFERMLDGQMRFREEFAGRLWLEVFVVWGMNSVPADAERISRLATRLTPDRIHLNTAVRPSSEEYVLPVPRQQMDVLASLFDPPAEVIGDFRATGPPSVTANEKTILAMLTRRPCTADQIVEVFGMHRNEVAKYLGELLRTHSIQAERASGEVFYRAAGASG